MKDKFIKVRVSDEEKIYFEKKSDEAGKSLSKLIFESLNKVEIKNREDERQRIIMLNRINANLNMIARWCNTYKGGAEAVEVIIRLIDIERAVRDSRL